MDTVITSSCHFNTTNMDWTLAICESQGQARLLSTASNAYHWLFLVSQSLSVRKTLEKWKNPKSECVSLLRGSLRRLGQGNELNWALGSNRKNLHQKEHWRSYTLRSSKEQVFVEWSEVTVLKQLSGIKTGSSRCGLWIHQLLTSVCRTIRG